MTTRNSHRMMEAIRSFRIVMFVVCLVVTGPSSVWAQSNNPFPVNDQIVPPPAPDSVVSETAAVTTRPLIVRGPCDPDYWIVSTRCGNDQVEAGQAYNYEVYRFDGPKQGCVSSMNDLLSSLQPGVPVCFMAHGSFVTWDSMLQDSAQTYQWLRQAAPCQPIHIIFYTWASDDAVCLPHLRVNKFGRRASMNGLYLADIVSKVSIDHPICLIGHSHGTRLVSSALHAMAGGCVDGRVFAHGPQPVRRIRVVLAAAAIDHVWLNPGERYDRALCPTEAVINLRNHADFPLLFYPLRRPFAAPALAITGLTNRDRESLGDSQQKIVDYNVTGQVGLGHIWAYYYSQPAIASAIRHYVYFDEHQSTTEFAR